MARFRSLYFISTMGSASSTSQFEGQLAHVKGEIKPKKLRSLHQQVLFEYPFLANIFESMLITDNRLPDCPIVFCNDLFEQMTCYPKEEIIGKNCRFLQGPDTDRNIVRSIRKAVDDGLELEVELLNYRKDGIPFYNVFLMLPIHATKKRDGAVHYFIAIQKDITILRQPGSDPHHWTSAEVGMWLYHNGLTSFLGPFSEAKMNGEKLFQLTDAEVKDIAEESTLSERKMLLTKIYDIKNNPSKAFPVNEAKIQEYEYKHPENPEENVRLGKENVDTSLLRSWWRSTLKPKKNAEEKKVGKLPEVNPFCGVQDVCSGNDVTIKVFYKRSITVIHVPETITYNLLIEKLQAMTRVPVKCRYKDLDGDWISMDDDDSVEAAIVCTHGGTVSLKVSKKFRPLSKEKQMYLNGVPSGIVVVDSEGSVMFMNIVAQELLQQEPHEFMRRKFSECVGVIDFSLVGKTQSLTNAEQVQFQALVSPNEIEYNRIVMVM